MTFPDLKINRVMTYGVTLSPLIAILYFWWDRASFGGLADSFISLGRLWGLSVVYFILVQLLLRSRNTLLESNVGFETLNRLHKRNGYLIYSLLLLHGIFLSLGYALASRTNIFVQLYLFLFTYEDVFKAFIGFLILTGVVISSIYIIRKGLPYELWYFVHLFTYIAILFAWDHQLKVGEDFVNNTPLVIFWYALYWVVIGLMLYSRVFKQLYLFYRQRFYISKIVKETSDTYSFYIKGRNISTFNFIPGQFVFIRVLTKDRWWESHPFSFSEAPNGEYIRLTIKESGDFTSLIKKIKKGTQVILDGPHGEFVVTNMKKILFIAGGVGITPIRAQLETIKNKNTVLLYTSKTKNDIIFKNELRYLSRKNKFKIIHVITRKKKLKQRITLELIKKSVKRLSEYDIFLCGPVGMVNELKEALKTVVPSSQIHIEEFSL